MRRFGRRRAGERARGDSTQAPTPVPEVTVRLVCAFDSLTHDVGDDEFTRARSGRYRALCGTLVAAAPMAQPEGDRCDECDAVIRAARSRRRRRSA